MLYRTHQDVSISEVGVGCYALSGVYGHKDPGAFERMLAHAVEAGVNFFDTAAAYTDGERVLGRALKPYRERVLIATKIGVRDELEADLSPEAVRRACDRSLETLGTDWIDLYQVHFDDPNTPIEATLAGLEDLFRLGKIRNYGICHLPANKIRAYCERGRPFSILMELNAASREARETLLPLARRFGVAAIAFSVTGRGLLTGRFERQFQFEAGDIRRIDPLFQRERRDSALRIANKLAELARLYGKTPAQAAIAWALAQSGVVCALTGPSTIEHLTENVGGSGWSFTQETLDDLEVFFETDMLEMRRAQEVSLRNILTTPLPGDPVQAFTDLVYAIETAILLEAVSEPEVIPLFHRLFALKKELAPETLPYLEAIRSQVMELILDYPLTDVVTWFIFWPWFRNPDGWISGLLRGLS